MEENTLCPKFQKAVEILSKRWNALIINQLMLGSQRFCTINSSMPISGRLLSERLKELENEGIVTREVFPEVPVRVEYSLTEKGFALQNAFKEINLWAQEWVRTNENTKEDEK